MTDAKARLDGPGALRLAVDAIVSPRTVARVYAGGGNAFSRERVAAAAKRLGLPEPPPRDPSVTAPNYNSAAKIAHTERKAAIVLHPAMDVLCPTCGATPGIRCHTTSGSLHGSRKRVAFERRAKGNAFWE